MTMQRTGFLPAGREIEYDEGSRQPGVLRPGVLRQVAVWTGWLLGRLRGRFAKYRSRRALAQLDDRLLDVRTGETLAEARPAESVHSATTARP